MNKPYVSFFHPCLILLAILVGCTDRDEEWAYEIVYPQDENYEPFEITDAVGELKLEDDQVTWRLSFGEKSNFVLNSSVGFEDGIQIDVTNMNEEYKSMEGSVKVSGIAQFKYILFPKGGNPMGMKTYCYTFKIKDIAPINSKTNDSIM